MKGSQLGLKTFSGKVRVKVSNPNPNPNPNPKPNPKPNPNPNPNPNPDPNPNPNPDPNPNPNPNPNPTPNPNPNPDPNPNLLLRLWLHQAKRRLVRSEWRNQARGGRRVGRGRDRVWRAGGAGAPRDAHGRGRRCGVAPGSIVGNRAWWPRSAAFWRPRPPSSVGARNGSGSPGRAAIGRHTGGHERAAQVFHARRRRAADAHRGERVAVASSSERPVLGPDLARRGGSRHLRRAARTLVSVRGGRARPEARTPRSSVRRVEDCARH